MNFRDKRGDVSSIVYVVMFLVIAGIIIFFIVDLNVELFDGIESALNEAGYNSTEAMTQATEFKDTNNSRVWDYGFLGLFFGILIAIGMSAYAIRISPIFYWIYGILSIFVLVMGTMLSNFWQGMAAEPEFADTLVNFPIMNAMLGSYYPLIVTAMIIFSMVILFGKPRGQEGYI